jgi:pimeloyl-ACP methyl ester carboxylesterase
MTAQPHGLPGVANAYPGQPPQSKQLATLQALFALRGYALHQLADSTLLVERWGYCRPVATVEDAAGVLAQLGGAPATWVGHG